MTVSSILMFNYWYMKVKLNQIPPISPIVSNVNVTLTLLYLTLSNDQLYSGRTGQVRNARVGGRVLGGRRGKVTDLWGYAFYIILVYRLSL